MQQIGVFERSLESFIACRGLQTILGAGDSLSRHGIAVHDDTCNSSIIRFQNADADFLIVPQQGVLNLLTESRKIQVKPNQICVIKVYHRNRPNPSLVLLSEWHPWCSDSEFLKRTFPISSKECGTASAWMVP